MGDPPDKQCALAQQVWSLSKSESVDEDGSEESICSVVERQVPDEEIRQFTHRSAHADPTAGIDGSGLMPDMVIPNMEAADLGIPCEKDSVSMQKDLGMERFDLEKENTCEDVEVSMQEHSIMEGRDFKKHGKFDFPCMQSLSNMAEMGPSLTENLDVIPSPILAQPLVAISGEEAARLDFLEAMRPAHTSPTAQPHLALPTCHPMEPNTITIPQPNLSSDPKPTKRLTRSASKTRQATATLRAPLVQPKYKKTQPKPKNHIRQAHKPNAHTTPITHRSTSSLQPIEKQISPTLLRRTSAGRSSSADTAAAFAPTGTSDPKSGGSSDVGVASILSSSATYPPADFLGSFG